MPSPVHILSKSTSLSPGTCKGFLKTVRSERDARNVNPADIVISTDLAPLLSTDCSGAAGFVIKGSEADHTIAYVRELWKPAIALNDLQAIHDGFKATLDGTNGILYGGWLDLPSSKGPERLRYRPKTKIYLFAGIPRMAQAAASLQADGVGLLRTNLMVQEIGRHPISFVASGASKQLEDLLTEGILRIAIAFRGKPVWVRTMDFATSELRRFSGGGSEQFEDNPLLGWRGLIRELDQVELLRIECCAVRRVVREGFANVGILFPLVRTVAEYREAKMVVAACGLRPHKDLRVGMMFETPAAALEVEEFVKTGVDFAFIGVNDLTQYALAADRTNTKMCRVYNPANAAVRRLIVHILEVCRVKGAETSMSFQTPLLPVLGEFVKAGLDSVSVLPDAINAVGRRLVEHERSQ